ncbi:hypothetical protein V8B97DRAFT_87803 [Scleroderma yunnanense]
MRAQHTAYPLPAYPVYSCTFVADDLLVAGGGGGTSRSGIKNKLKLFRISHNRELASVSELELGKDEDAPMSMAADLESQTLVCGINSAVAKLDKGENENCRKFSISGAEHKFTPLATRGTLPFVNKEDYQRVTVLSPDVRVVAVAGEHDLTLLAHNNLSPVAQPIHVAKGEIYDATLSSSHLILATTVSLLVYILPASLRCREKGKEKEDHLLVSPDISTLPELTLVKTIEIPAISGVPAGATATFRAARLQPTKTDLLYSVVNVTLPRARKAKTAAKQAYVLKWSISTSDDTTFSATLEASRKVSKGNLTCFDVSRDGRLLAFGVSDYSLGVLDANTLAPLLSILKAHEFPITTLRFNPSSRLLVSGGVDSIIRVVTIPEKFGGLL